MKKSNSVIIGIIIVIVVVAGAYMVFHKSDKKTTSTSSAASGQSSVPAVNNAVIVTKTDAKLGQYLADPSGKPLYTYGGDSSGVSNCTGSCLASWPPYADSGSTSGLPSGIATIKRSDNGQTQYTYNGMPLYYFVSDSVGHPTGNGVDNFQLAKPAASSSSGSSGSTPSSSGSSSSSNPYNY